jgi:hypothetical protein
MLGQRESKQLACIPIPELKQKRVQGYYNISAFRNAMGFIFMFCTASVMTHQRLRSGPQLKSYIMYSQTLRIEVKQS